MNKVFTSLLFAACCFANGIQAIEPGLSQEFFGEEEVVFIQKIYIHPSEIYFSNNKIFVQTKKGVLEIPSIQSDFKGIYYRAVHPQNWVCKKCGEYNINTYYCENCEKSPSDKQEIN